MTIKKGLPLILGIAATVVVLTLLYLFNPVETEYAPKCIFHAVTGLSCPGCGMQRFLHAFMHGNFLEAIQYNYMLIVLFPYLLLFGIERFILIGERQKRWNSIIEGRVISTIMIILAPSWFIIRNILHI
ncbi:MAG: DUF2752 domain-containing protein [Prevotella sp.]|jgi:hypothetical protein|uniref:DUF2752 domain-containing protein n=2 Tax=Prevotella communis TaxID=2913614 RepID=UPI000B823F7B|nr:DUF2752 domain-containing protein [Prevotella communis]MCR5472688.1 DUF2752 domain-containing protein [Prevotella sp.]